MTGDYKAFNIYKPSEKFVWTRERIFYILIFVPVVIMFFVSVVFKIPDHDIPGWFSWITGVPMFTAITGSCINMWFPEELKGKIEGKLIFENEKITIDNKIYRIRDLKYVEISQNDHKGRWIYRNGLNGMFSQGCDNLLKIRLSDHRIIRTLFQIKHPGELLQIVNQLNFYTELGLMTKEARFSTLNYNDNGI